LSKSEYCVSSKFDHSRLATRRCRRQLWADSGPFGIYYLNEGSIDRYCCDCHSLLWLAVPADRMEHGMRSTKIVLFLYLKVQRFLYCIDVFETTQSDNCFSFFSIELGNLVRRPWTERLRRFARAVSSRNFSSRNNLIVQLLCISMVSRCSGGRYGTQKLRKSFASTFWALKYSNCFHCRIQTLDCICSVHLLYWSCPMLVGMGLWSIKSMWSNANQCLSIARGRTNKTRHSQRASFVEACLQHCGCVRRSINICFTKAEPKNRSLGNVFADFWLRKLHQQQAALGKWVGLFLWWVYLVG
jgi:hypothetical protein